jgi:hypothetical protein
VEDFRHTLEAVIFKTDLLELNNMKNTMSSMMVVHGQAQEGLLSREDHQKLKQLPRLQRRKSTCSVLMMMFLLLLPLFPMVKAKELRLLPLMMMISMTSKVLRGRPLQAQSRQVPRFHLYLRHLPFSLILYELVVSLLPLRPLHLPA